jgi:hypothetical protein
LFEMSDLTDWPRSCDDTIVSQRVGRAFHHSRNRPSVSGDSITRRTSSGVAVAGERFKYAANRSQLSMWLLCDAGPNLRAVMSSIMR